MVKIEKLVATSGPPIVSVSIMAHPDRSEYADRLARQLADLPTRIVYDPEPRGTPSTVRVARLAWRPWHSSATHHLLVQDDVVIHLRFVEQVQDAIRSQPTAALSFFAEWGSFTSNAVRIASFAGRPWVTQPDTYLSTTAMSLPVAEAAALSAFLCDAPDLPDDQAVFSFVHSRGLPHYVSNPNLVDHDVLPSLVGNGIQGVRRATNFAPDANAPADWWNRAPLTSLTRVPSVHWSTGSPSSYEAPTSEGPLWTIRAPRDHWGAYRDDLSAIIRRAFTRPTQSPADVRATSPMLAAAIILCDQISVASNYTDAATPFGRHIARESVRTLAPGTLRRVAAELGFDVDHVGVAETFLEIYENAYALLHVRRG